MKCTYVRLYTCIIRVKYNKAARRHSKITMTVHARRIRARHSDLMRKIEEDGLFWGGVGVANQFFVKIGRYIADERHSNTYNATGVQGRKGA